MGLYIGNHTVTNAYIGSINNPNMYLGNTRVYPSTVIITYTLTNCVLHLSDGSLLLPDNSNYAYISGTLTEYHNGAIYSTQEVICLPQNDSALSDYFTIDNEHKIHFNYNTYKATNLYSIYGETYTTAWTASYNGTSYSGTLFLTTKSNKIESTSTVSTVNVTANPMTLQVEGGNVNITTTLSNTVSNRYTSGYLDVSINHSGTANVYCNNIWIGTSINNQTITYSVPENETTSIRYFLFKSIFNSVTSNIVSVSQEAATSSYYYVDESLCIGCGSCVDVGCPTDAISIDSGVAYIDPSLCIGCELCVGVCPTNAIKRR